MSVKVIRKKERLTSQWTELEVYMDDEKKTAIYGHDSAEINLDGETGNLKVKQPLSKSVEKQVKHGDIVEISNSPLITYSFYLMPIILIFIFIALSADLLSFWIVGIVTAAYIIFMLSIKPLQIEIITEEGHAAEADINHNNT